MKFTSFGKPEYSELVSEKKIPPRVIFSQKAIKWIKAMVEVHSTEVGWYNLVDKLDDNTYYIRDLFYPDHDLATGTTCEISAKGEADVMNYLVNNNREEDIGKISCWGHSHVNMGVGPSGQDDAQILKLLERGGDFFIRIIVNKKNVINVAVYDRVNNIVFTGLTFEIEGAEESTATAKFNRVARIMRGASTGNIAKIMQDVANELAHDTEYEEIKKEVEELKKVNIKPVAKTYYSGQYNTGHYYKNQGTNKNGNGGFYQNKYPKHNIYNDYDDYGEYPYGVHYGRGVQNETKSTTIPNTNITPVEEEFEIPGATTVSREELELYLMDFKIDKFYDENEINVLYNRGVITDSELKDNTLTYMFDSIDDGLTGGNKEFVGGLICEVANRFALEEYLIDANKISTYLDKEDIEVLLKREILTKEEVEKDVWTTEGKPGL
jgi:cation transport regulator ChaC